MLTWTPSLRLEVGDHLRMSPSFSEEFLHTVKTLPWVILRNGLMEPGPRNGIDKDNAVNSLRLLEAPEKRWMVV